MAVDIYGASIGDFWKFGVNLDRVLGSSNDFLAPCGMILVTVLIPDVLWNVLLNIRSDIRKNFWKWVVRYSDLAGSGKSTDDAGNAGT